MLESHLDTLEQSNLIHVARAEPELEYLFRHALVQDAAYDSLLKADRRRLHRQVGEILEQLYPERQRELASLLAHHFHEAGEPEQARHYFTLAGDHAASSYANREAEQHYRHALFLATEETQRAYLLDRLAATLSAQDRYVESLEVMRQAIALYQALGRINEMALLYVNGSWALWSDGDTPGSLAFCQEGLAALAGTPETAALAALLHETGRVSLFNGLLDQARGLCLRALAIAERLGASAAEGSSLTTLGLLSHQAPEEAVALLHRAAEILPTSNRPWYASRAYNNLGEILAYTLGNFEEAKECYRLSSAVVVRYAANAFGELFGLNNLAETLLWQGNFAEAEAMFPTLHHLLAPFPPMSEVAFSFDLLQVLIARYRGAVVEAVAPLQRHLEEMERIGNLQNQHRLCLHLGEAMVELGRWEAAEGLLQQAVAVRRRGLGMGIMRSDYLLAQVYAHQGRTEVARTVLDEAHQWLRGYQGRLNEAFLRRTEAHLALAEGRLPDAHTAFERAAALYEETGIRWYHAQLLRQWAHVRQKQPNPDPAAARTLLHHALTLFEAMDVPHYAAQVREEMERLSE